MGCCDDLGEWWGKSELSAATSQYEEPRQAWRNLPDHREHSGSPSQARLSDGRYVVCSDVSGHLVSGGSFQLGKRKPSTGATC